MKAKGKYVVKESRTDIVHKFKIYSEGDSVVGDVAIFMWNGNYCWELHIINEDSKWGSEETPERAMSNAAWWARNILNAESVVLNLTKGSE